MNPNKIRASQTALDELKRLEKMSFNRNPSSWHEQCEKAVKIATVNCAGILPHLRDIRKDYKLLEANVINLLETSLPSDTDTENINVDGFNGKFINIGNGKGIATFIKEGTLLINEKDITLGTLQITKSVIEGVDSIIVYRSSSHSILETTEIIKSMIDVSKPTLIKGDFNLCTIKDRNNSLSAKLEKLGFKEIVRKATQIEGGHIDHCYWLDKTQIWEQPKLERYSPYWSDHDALLVTIRRKELN